MAVVDTIVRAELAQTKVQLHQMTTALYMSVDALDAAFKSVERIVDRLGESHLDAEMAREELDTIREARCKILNMRQLLR